MAAAIGRKAYHVLMTCIFVWTLYFDVVYHRVPGRPFYAKSFYLTLWNLVLQTVFWVLTSCFYFTNSRKIKCWVDYLYATVIFPIGIFTSVLFWGLYAIDRELVFPRRLDQFVPLWFNHVTHTTPIISVMLEHWLVHHRYPERARGVRAASVVGVVYVVWIFAAGWALGKMPYPILNILGWGAKLAFVGTLLALLSVVYILGDTISCFCWKTKIEAERAKQKQ